MTFVLIIAFAVNRAQERLRNANLITFNRGLNGQKLTRKTFQFVNSITKGFYNLYHTLNIMIFLSFLCVLNKNFNYYYDDDEDTLEIFE